MWWCLKIIINQIFFYIIISYFNVHSIFFLRQFIRILCLRFVFLCYLIYSNFSLLFSTMITLLFHCLALFKMLRFYRAIKFENLVILGGAVECFVLIISTISFYDIFLEIGVAVQNLIELYIIRRLMRIIQRKNSNIKHPLYQT